MIIKVSAALRNEYGSISNLAKATKKPIYITKNGVGDLVLMSIEVFERREQILKLLETVYIYHIADTRTDYTKLFF